MWEKVLKIGAVGILILGLNCVCLANPQPTLVSQVTGYVLPRPKIQIEQEKLSGGETEQKINEMREVQTQISEQEIFQQEDYKDTLYCQIQKNPQTKYKTKVDVSSEEEIETIKYTITDNL